MNNKQVLLTLLAILLLALSVSYYMTRKLPETLSKTVPATVQNATTTQKVATMTATTARTMPKTAASTATEYIIKNISTLSPVKAPAGQTFRVSGMQISTATGTVNYLIGKTEYTASFTYSVDATDKVTISPFVMKKK